MRVLLQYVRTEAGLVSRLERYAADGPNGNVKRRPVAMLVK